MSSASSQHLSISAAQAGLTVAALLRSVLPGQSWSQVRQFVSARHARINGDLCLDAARRLKEGDTVEILARPAPKPHGGEAVVIRYLDEHIVVVEKPAGINTVRHPAERDWSEKRKAVSPTLQDLVAKIINRQGSGGRKPPVENRHSFTGGLRSPLAKRLRVVQRLDKDTSGLVVFARTVAAERGLGKQFHAHTVTRRYLAVVPGYLPPQRIETQLVRNRGDGRRGSTPLAPPFARGKKGGIGKEAITHIEVVERLPKHTLLSCRLETGRTHQIRIHLAELGHPVCGEKVYNKQRDGTIIADESRSPRLALHAAELGFVHPVTGAAVHWEMPLPQDLSDFLERLRGRSSNP